MKLRIILALAIIFLLPTSVIAQTQGDPVSFNLSDDHTLDAFVTSSLVWEEGVDQLVKINFTMSDFKENNSEIHIQILQIFAIESGGGGELLGQNATEKVMTVANSSVEYSDSLQSPRAADRFYLNITFFAFPTGGGADETPDRYSFRFPEDSTIIVQRDNLVPVVNLYGFPPQSYFRFWLPIYGGFLVALLSPGIIFGFSKLNERRAPNIIKEEEET
ncbi:MAG: hypothetical protein ACXAE3_17175 [Candidatus Kariarchaeaceae archaeon]|jgi:hypothetical protein